MGRKAKILLAALIATPAGAQDNLLINPGFQQGLTGWSSSGPGGAYSGCGPAGGICYVFSYLTGTVQQTIVAPETYTGYSVSFQYRLPCNNSIFGYCENPLGPQDWLNANLSLYLNDTSVENIQLLSIQAYQPQYQTFSLTGTTSAFNTATISFSGQDTGFWGGPYGPQIDNVSLSFTNPAPAQQEPAFTPVSITPSVTPAPNPVAIPEEEEQIAAAEVAVEEAVTAAEETGIDLAVAEETIVEESTTEAVTEEAVQEDDSMAEDANDPPPPPGLLPGSAPPPGSESTIMVSGARRDRNVEFFQSEAVEEADVFARETVIQASLQNVAFVAQADAQYAAQYGEQTTTETAGVTYAIQPTEGPTFASVITTTIGSDTTTPSGQAQQMELLGMGMQGELAAGPVVDVGDVNTGDGETMAQLGAVPAGYSAYTQARIPDMPFYQPRDIYKGRRIPDANMALYRMMSGQDARWQDMVDEQYE